MIRLRRAVFNVLFHLLIWATMVGTWLDQRLRGDVGFPRDPAALQEAPAWCLAQLVAAGVVPAGAEVVSLEVIPFKFNEAFRSQVARVCLRWQLPDRPEAEDEPDAGESRCIAKFAPKVTSLRDHAVYLLQDNHGKEFAAYDALGREPGLGLPRVYFSQLHKLTGNLCLLLEDLTRCVEVTERAGCPLPLCELAIDGFATLHAHGWGRPEVAPGLTLVPDPVIDFICSRFVGDDADVFTDALLAAWRHDHSGVVTTLHGDARVGNMLFPDRDAPDDPGRFALIDWQAARRGRGVFDVAYFLALSVNADVRRAHETALLDRYHAGLTAAGVTDYGRDTLTTDYRNAQLLTLGFVTLPFLSAESSQTERNQDGLADLAAVWTQRMAEVMQEMDLPWLAAHTGLPEAALTGAVRRLEAKAWAALEGKPPLGAERQQATSPSA